MPISLCVFDPKRGNLKTAGKRLKGERRVEAGELAWDWGGVGEAGRLVLVHGRRERQSAGAVTGSW